MSEANTEVLLVGPAKPLIVTGLTRAFRLHYLAEASEVESLSPGLRQQIRAMAVSLTSPKPHQRIDGPFMALFPQLRMIASFGVGYDHVDARWAGSHGITVTNTPEVLTEEVADTALGLLLCTLRRLPQAMRYLLDGHWTQAPFPLTNMTLRGRTVGLVGMGRIGQAIARRLAAFGVAVVYHSRRPQPGVSYNHYPLLEQMAAAVDVLIVVIPGNADTHHLINAQILQALGPNGVLINVGRGSTVDEAALIAALRDGRLCAAGLDVFANEPHVPQELMKMDNVVLLPHVGSATVHTRAAMDQLVVDNLLSWGSGNGPLTPVAETRVPR
jgi:lactate dehydrogenase-like 2-hydroxyacid dehydrogenase